jgi:hypothetical protein
MLNAPHAIKPHNYMDIFDYAVSTGKPDLKELIPAWMQDSRYNENIHILLLLAEYASSCKEWHTAAQLYVHTAIKTFRQDGGGDFIHHANNAILLVSGRNARLTSRADFVLYACRSGAAALRQAGYSESQSTSWLNQAVSESSRGQHAGPDNIAQALQAIEPGNAAISHRYRASIGAARSMLLHGLPPHGDGVAEDQPSRGWDSGHVHMALLLGALVLTGVLSWQFRNIIQFPHVSLFFQGSNWLGAALLWWPALLVITWIFASLESKRTRTFSVVAPRHIFASQPVISGEVISFQQDMFFHIFQFIWLPLIVIALLMFAQYETFPVHLAPIWNEASGGGTLDKFKQSLNAAYFPDFSSAQNFISCFRVALNCDSFSIILATFTTTLFTVNQLRIQRKRQTSLTTLCWWDIRISRPGWFVRLVMVGIDTFLGAIILVKITSISLVAYDIILSDGVSISYFSPDGAGGLKFVVDIFRTFSWLVFTFGVLVISSMYFHRHMTEYRSTDITMLLMYAFLVILIMIPLFILEVRLQEVRDGVLAAFPAPGGRETGSALPAAAQNLREISLLRDWNISAIRGGMLDNPMLPLGFQVMVMLTQHLLQPKALK